MNSLCIIFSFCSDVMLFIAQSVNHKIWGSDLDSLAMHADHVGKMHKQGGGSSKPTLILAVQAKALECFVSGRWQKCEPMEYLRLSVSNDHTARSAFSRIELVHIPELTDKDFDKLQPNNFYPKDVEHYWKAIERIGQIIKEEKSDDLSTYWTGEELGRMFELLVSMINADIHIHPPSVRMSIMMSSAEAEARKWTETFGTKMQPHVEEPYRSVKDYENLLSELRSDAEAAVLKKYDVYEDEPKMFDAIQEAVAEVFNQEVNAINAKVETRKHAIKNHAQSVYESVHHELSSVELSLFTKLTGDADEVDITLRSVLKGLLQQYHAALEGWILPAKIAIDNLNKLTSRSLSIWTIGHQINNAKHINRQHTLRDQALPPVEFFYSNKHRTKCRIDRKHVRDLMATKYPDFFSDEALRNTIRIDAKFHSITNGSGRLVLHGEEDKEYKICHNQNSSVRGHGSSLSFNPVSKELHSVIWGWGTGKANCHRGNWMNGVSFTIICNALSAAPKHYDAPYVKGETPTFWV